MLEHIGTEMGEYSLSCDGLLFNDLKATEVAWLEVLFSKDEMYKSLVGGYFWMKCIKLYLTCVGIKLQFEWIHHGSLAIQLGCIERGARLLFFLLVFYVRGSVVNSLINVAFLVLILKKRRCRKVEGF